MPEQSTWWQQDEFLSTIHVLYGRDAGTPRTWADIERAAINDPLLHRLVAAVDAGYVTREQGLLDVVIGQSEMIRRFMEEKVEFLRNEPARPTIPGT
jgi:hypothetical protein